MPKKTSHFVCQQCGYISPNFLGRCPECGTWSSLVEQLAEPSPLQKGGKGKPVRGGSEIVRTGEIEQKDYRRTSTQIAELDRVLGGGIVWGSVVLVAGDPGIGKSTLLSQLALNVSNDTLYVAGEESAHQIKLRIERIDPKASLAVLNETDVDVICNAIETRKPPLVIVDSIQTLETMDLESAAGSVSQVRECTHRLQRTAKSTHVPVFIVGHVTKEGTVAGPRTLEHVVDVVLSLEGDPATNFRIVRSNKNRFGSTDEVGIFEMRETGMKEVLNPSEVFLEEMINAPGSAVTAIVTGLRPVLLEVQALVSKTNSPIARRVGTGIDLNRLQILVAILSKRCKLPLYDMDVFVNITGGIKVSDPSIDLAVCMAIYSSFKDINLPKNSCFIGEVGLIGELRSVRQLEKREVEAKKLGFNKVFASGKYKTLNQVIKELA